MKITINGESNAINTQEGGITLDALIKKLDYHPKLIVIEYNGEILQPPKWTNQQMKDGDILEIVTIVGGG